MIVEYRDAVVALIRQTMPQLREVGSHGGTFTLDEAKRRIANSPSVFVAALGTQKPQMAPTGQVVLTVQMAAYVFTRHHGQAQADSQGWAVATAVLSLLSGRHVLDGSLVPEEMEIENLWSGELDRNGACIMAVLWSIEVVVGRDWQAEGLDIRADGFVFPDDFIVREGAEPVAPDLSNE